MLSLALFISLAVSPQQAPITIGSLLTDMTDPDRLAEYPSPDFRQLQASSYDRAQTDPNNAKTWHANQDYGQFIRTEKHGARTEWVIMEHTGPGAVTRIWTPLLKDKDKMIVRFYFDGSDTPGIEEPFNDLMRGKGRIKPPFAFIAWRDPGVTDGVGADMYFPIPFAKRCKITLSEVPFYYSVDYRAYPAGTTVQTFSLDQVERLGSTTKRLGELLLANGPDSIQDQERALKQIASGKSEVINLKKGPRAINFLALVFHKEIDPRSLRSVVVEIKFDGERTVWCPASEFFGGGTSAGHVSDRNRQADKLDLVSCWEMPYSRSAVIRIVNLGKATITPDVLVFSKPWHWDSRSMHFHATWRHQYPLATRPMSDWNYLEAKGTGVYVGDTLTVMNPSPAWYGEGDERVYVDGEKFPSQLGTGTEDYYGYAWGMADGGFSSPFISMPARDRKGRDNWMGYTTTSRVRGLDAIPFTKSFKFDMEIWHWADCQVEYSAATFWYAKPGATSNRPPQPEEAAKPLPEIGGVIKGSIECETMDVIRKSDDVKVSTQSGNLVTQGFWSSGEQLFLQAYKPGDFVELRLPVKKSGKQHVILYATKSYDYGVVRFSINGALAKDIDLWSDKPIASGPIDLGVFDLKSGEAILRVEMIGTNPKSRGDRYYTGLDCVVMKP